MKFLFCFISLFCIANVWSEEKVYKINTGDGIVEIRVKDIGIKVIEETAVINNPALHFLVECLKIERRQTLGERNFDEIKKQMKPENPEEYYKAYDKDDPFKMFDPFITQEKQIHQQIVLGEFVVFTSDVLWKGNKMMTGYIVKKFDDGYFLVPDASDENELLRTISAFRYDMDKVAEHYKERLAKGEIFDEFDPRLFKVDKRFSLFLRSIAPREHNVPGPDRLSEEEKKFLEQYGEVLVVDGNQLCVGYAEEAKELRSLYRKLVTADKKYDQGFRTLPVCRDMPDLENMLHHLFYPNPLSTTYNQMQHMLSPKMFRNLSQGQEKLLAMNRNTAELFIGKKTLAGVENRALNRYVNALYREEPTKKVYEGVWNDVEALSQHSIFFRVHYFIMAYCSGAFELDTSKLRAELQKIDYTKDARSGLYRFDSYIIPMFLSYRIMHSKTLSDENVLKLLTIYSEQFEKMKAYALPRQWYNKDFWTDCMKDIEEFTTERKLNFKLPEL